MRKGKVIAGLLTIALCITPCNGGVYQTFGIVKAENAETEQITSQDGKTVYRELEDGTVSIVLYTANAEISKDSSGQSKNTLTFPDTVDGKVVSGIEGSALDKNTSTTDLTQIVLPKNLRSLDVEVFRECFYNTYIQIDDSNAYFHSEDGVLFNKEQTKLIRVPEVYTPTGNDTAATEYVIPDTVTEIGDAAFYNTSGDMQITISKNVESIGEYALYHSLNGFGKFTFTVVPENSHFTVTENGDLFSKDKTVLYRHVYTSDEVTYTIPDTVTEIASVAFEGSTDGFFDGLAEVVIPESVTKIGASAFEGCSMLGDAIVALRADTPTEITIPDSVTYIGESAFEGCGMESVVLSKNLATIEAGVFKGCTYMKEITIPDSVTYIGVQAFYSSGVETIQLSKELEKIDVDAFGSCTSLSELTVPDKVTTLEDGAFAYCTALKKVVFGKSVKNIGYLTFYGCSELESIEFSDGVETIGAEAFEDCPELQEVSLPDSVTEIGEQAFGYVYVFDETTGWYQEKVSDFAIICTEGSTAAQYAKDNSITRKDPPENSSQKPDDGGEPSQKPTQTPAGSSAPDQKPSYEPGGSAVPGQTQTQAPAQTQTPDSSALPVPTASQQPDSSAKPEQSPSREPDASAAPSQIPTQTPAGSASQDQTSTAAPSQTPSQTPKASVTPAPVKTPDTGAKVSAPSAVKLVLAKNVKGKKLQITWTKNAKASGYELQYAASSKFKGAKSVVIKSSKTIKTSIKKLKKGKKYFVRVRAYVTADSGKKYSKWSNVRKAVIKK